MRDYRFARLSESDLFIAELQWKWVKKGWKIFMSCFDMKEL